MKKTTRKGMISNDKKREMTTKTRTQSLLDSIGKTRSALPVLYALLLEAAELGLLAFALLLTVEAVLPGIISLRLNLAEPFTAILLLLGITAALGRYLEISFPFTPNKKSPLTWIGISWLAFLLTLSTIHFPYWAVPLIVGSLFIAAHLFWKTLFRKE